MDEVKGSKQKERGEAHKVQSGRRWNMELSSSLMTRTRTRTGRRRTTTTKTTVVRQFVRLRHATVVGGDT